ncbi:unnamed protein product, partial [Porites evermanni]
DAEGETTKRNENSTQMCKAQLMDVPLVNSEGKMLLPPAELGKGCPSPVYANPRQVLRILKRREAKKRLARSGKLKNRAKRDKKRAGNQEDGKTNSDGASPKKAG